MARALIIDDEKNILNILRTLLVKLDFEVKMAHVGREGIELFEEGHDFDLVITDIRMPRADGNQVAKHIRGSGKPDTPIVAMSGYNDKADGELFDFTLEKPFNLKELMTVVKAIEGENEPHLT
jgi:two-component system cell cycle sensor histidine kinase/response regulator CckA